MDFHRDGNYLNFLETPSLERNLRCYQEKHYSETILLFLKLSDFRVHTKANKGYCQIGWVGWEVDKNLDLPNFVITFSKAEGPESM